MFFWLVRIVYDGATLLLPVVLVVGAAWTFRENRRRAAWTVALAVLAVATRIYATHVEPQRLQIHQEAVATDAPDAPPIRVLHLSDIQTDAVGAWEARVIDEALALEPDLAQRLQNRLLVPTSAEATEADDLRDGVSTDHGRPLAEIGDSPRPGRRFHREDRNTIEPDLAPPRFQHARDAAEKRRLARRIGADHRGESTGGDST